MGSFLATLGVILGGPSAAKPPVAPEVIAATLATAPAAPERQSLRRRPASAAGTRISAGVIDAIDFNAEVRGTRWVGTASSMGIAAKMMRDPHVRQSIDTIAGPLCSAKWRFRPASKAPKEREAARYAQWAFVERLPWDQHIRRLVRGYAANGHHLLEMTDDNVDLPEGKFPLHPGGGVGIAPTDLLEIPASTIDQWHQSKANARQLAGIRQFVQGSDVEKAGFIDVSADRIIRFTYDQEGADFAGLPILRSAYQPWKLKIAFLTIDAIKHERTGVGTPWLEAAEDADEADLEAAEVILEQMRANEKGYLVTPHGYKFQWAGASTNDGTNLNEAIERCNKDIFINVAAGFMLLGLTGRTGSYALGSTQQGAHHLSIDGHARFIRTPFNVGCDGWSPIRRITALNYGPKVGVPQLEARNLPTRPWAEIAKNVYEGIRVGAIRMDDGTEEELREMLELDPFDAETSRAVTVQAGSVANEDDREDELDEQGDEVAADEMPVDDASLEGTGKAAAAAKGEALNGAQITSLRNLLIDVATRQLPRDSGVKTIQAAFPLEPATVEDIMGDIGRTFFVEKSSAPATQPDTDDDTEPEEQDGDA